MDPEVSENKSDRPLRILMLLHAPWRRELGGARIQMELAEEFKAMGHQVEKFDFVDAFPKKPLCRLTELFRAQFFSGRAVEFVKKNAKRFDVIDALESNLPVSKREMNFDGLLVARSIGLIPFYAEFDAESARKWPQARNWKSVFHIAIGKLAQRHTRDFPLRSFQAADLISLMNDDERQYVDEKLGFGEKARAIPGGLSDARMEAFASARCPANERLANKTVAFVGAWSRRKGSLDWGAVIRQVRESVPGAKFQFLGVSVSVDSVLGDLGLPACDWIQIAPKFASDDLPALVSSATVGALPSYIEGFGFSVLEMLASGMPVAAYDVPGPRAMLRGMSETMLTPSGDAKKFAAAIANLLRLPPSRYAAVSGECLSAAGRFRWKNIAVETMAAYREGLQRLGRNKMAESTP